MNLYVIRRPSAWANLQELEAAGVKSARIGNDEMPNRVRWIRSYVVKEADGRLGTVCIYLARDPESIARIQDASACPAKRSSRSSSPSSFAKTWPWQAQPPDVLISRLREVDQLTGAARLRQRASIGT